MLSSILPNRARPRWKDVSDVVRTIANFVALYADDPDGVPSFRFAVKDKQSIMGFEGYLEHAPVVGGSRGIANATTFSEK